MQARIDELLADLTAMGARTNITLTPPASLALPSHAELCRLAEKSNPTIAAARFEVEAAEDLLGAANSSFWLWPDHIQLAYSERDETSTGPTERAEGQREQWSVQVAFALPIFQTLADAASMQAERDRRHTELHVLLQQLRVQIQGRAAACRRASDALLEAQDRARELREGHKLARAKLTGQTAQEQEALLTMRRSELSLEAKLIQTRYRYYRAVVALETLLGCALTTL